MKLKKNKSTPRKQGHTFVAKKGKLIKKIDFSRMAKSEEERGGDSRLEILQGFQSAVMFYPSAGFGTH